MEMILALFPLALDGRGVRGEGVNKWI